MVDRLEWVGQEPPMQEINDLEEKAQAPVRWPAMDKNMGTIKTANSLWGKGSRAFFSDSRAGKVGDILIVKVEIKDKAELDNKTERKRENKDSIGANRFFGLENILTAWMPGKAVPATLLDVDGSMDNSGEGIIEREEIITTEVSAVVTQVLPNGNLVIYGSQEIRVNYETRQLTVEGVIRPEDISPSNEVRSNQIAEARISYGGKGLISDVQQPRMGAQLVDVLSPW